MELLDFLDRVEFLCKQKGLKRQLVYIKCGVGKNFGVSIRNGSEPSIGKVLALATELECSIDYLLGRTDNPQSHKGLSVTTGDIKDNTGVTTNVIGNSNSTVTISVPPGSNALAVINAFESLTPFEQARVLVYVEELQNKKKEEKL